MSILRGPSAGRTLAALILLGSAAVHAQFPQYTSPGATGDRAPSVLDELDAAYEAARWDLGGFKIEPWIGIREAAYVDNVFTTDGLETGDFTATIGAGLRGYLPLGTNLMLALHALPEYVWWQDLDERNRLNGRYGAGLFGNFNRVNLVIDATRVEQQSVVTSEFEQLLHNRTDRAGFHLDVAITRSFIVFASINQLEYEHLLEPRDNELVPNLASLDREETIGRAGVSLELGRRTRVGLGVEESEVDFESLNFDNSGTSPFVEVEFNANKLYIDAAVYDRSLEPEPGSGFLPYDDTTGSLLVQVGPEEGPRVDAYGRMQVGYSVGPGLAYFEEQILGGALNLRLGRRFAFRAFAESGTNDYVTREEAFAGRSDDIESYGASLSYSTAFGLHVVLDARQTTVDSNLATFDREINQIGMRLQIGEFLSWP